MLQPQVTLTPAAEKFIRRMVRFSEHPQGGFRLTVTAGGCSGYNSEFSVEPAPREGDSELQLGGVKVFLPAETSSEAQAKEAAGSWPASSVPCWAGCSGPASPT